MSKPIFMSTVGEQYTKTCVIDMIIIKASTAAADVYTLVDPTDPMKIVFDGSGATLQNVVYTFPTGLEAPNGFKLFFITRGSMAIYIR